MPPTTGGAINSQSVEKAKEEKDKGYGRKGAKMKDRS
jgi:hypothetical protein